MLPHCPPSVTHHQQLYQVTGVILKAESFNTQNEEKMKVGTSPIKEKTAALVKPTLESRTHSYKWVTLGSGSNQHNNIN